MDTAASVTVRRHGGEQATVVCAGEMDQAVIDELRAALAGAMTPDLQTLQLDMVGVTFLDSVGLGTILAAALQCEGAGIRFSLTASPAVSRLLSMTALADVIHGRPPPTP